MILVTPDSRGRISAISAGLERGRTYEAVQYPDGSVRFFPVRIEREPHLTDEEIASLRDRESSKVTHES